MSRPTGNPNMIPSSECLEALNRAGDGARRFALHVFRNLGGDIERWTRRDRLAMAHALRGAEDWLWVSGRGGPACDDLRKLRHRIESDV